MTDSDSSLAPNIPEYFDVVVVGVGAAGLYAALCLPAHLQVGIVSPAIFNHLQKLNGIPGANRNNVWLDLRPIPLEKIRSPFPNIIRVCQEWGIDLFNQPIPVSPAAHYWMGGITTDTLNQTSIPG